MNNVLLEREVEDGRVTLTVENHGSTGASPEITDIVSAEPSSMSDGATAIDMDDEWYIKWSPEVAGGDEATLTYEVDGEASFDVHVEGIDEEKLTINQ
jgi:DNA topoisomerase-6 subunit B